MRVVCIDASVGKKSGEVPNFKEGQVCNAIQSPIYKNSYNVLESLYSTDGRLQSWYKDRFIPLSEIDELELVNKKQLVNQ